MSSRSGKSVKAKKIAGALIAAFPNAVPPLVWKFDLEKNHSFTLTLQGEEGDWELGVTSPRGEFYSVTRFLSRDEAQEAFDRAQGALLKREHKFWNIVGPITTVLLVLFLGMSWISYARHEAALKSMSSLAPSGHIVPSTPMSALPSPLSPLSAPAPMPVGPADQVQQGVPLPADQVLTPPP